jgi:hypothetical protein
LRHKIQDLVSYGSWEPLKFGRGAGPAISHICFADDLILVSEATNEQAVLLCLLQEKLPLLSLPSLIFLRMSCKLLPFLHLRAKKHKFFADISFGDLLVIVGNSI